MKRIEYDRRLDELAMAWQRDYHRLYAEAKKWAPKGTRSEDLHDLIGDACVIATSKIGVYRPGSNMVAWLGRIVRGEAENFRRSGKRRTGIYGGKHRLAPYEPDVRPAGACVPRPDRATLDNRETERAWRWSGYRCPLARG